MKQLDGGQVDGQNMGRSEAIGNICKDLGLGDKSIKYAPLSMIETLQEQASQQTAKAAAASCRMPRNRRWTNTPCRTLR